jgi:hypothetical protein
MIKGKVILLCATAIAALGLLREITYPDPYDPKNLHYVGWKYHLLPMDPHRALLIMTHDAYSDRLVVGKTRDELRHRFGFVLTKDQVRPYLQEYCAAARPDNEVLFLNSNDYMVVMKDNRAVELVLCKG